MREILFRGKRVTDGKWLEGSLWLYNGPPKILTPGNCVGYDVNPDTVGQYTGLRDKNGQRIFEGDICRFREWDKGDMCWVGKVHWENQQFIISGGRNKECDTPFELQMSRFIPENIEVIGNIHDNPDLLEAAWGKPKAKD